jgi:hypothetical protein
MRFNLNLDYDLLVELMPHLTLKQAEYLLDPKNEEDYESNLLQALVTIFNNKLKEIV